MIDIYESKNLAMSAFLHAKKFRLDGFKKEKGLTSFKFIIEDDKCIKEAVDSFYKNSLIPVMDYWESIRTLKSIIYAEE